jgi:hypothetical protein
VTTLNSKLANLLADEQMKRSAICQSSQPPIKPVLASTNHALVILLLNLSERLAVTRGFGLSISVLHPPAWPVTGGGYPVLTMEQVLPKSRLNRDSPSAFISPTGSSS